MYRRANSANYRVKGSQTLSRMIIGFAHNQRTFWARSMLMSRKKEESRSRPESSRKLKVLQTQQRFENASQGAQPKSTKPDGERGNAVSVYKREQHRTKTSKKGAGRAWMDRYIPKCVISRSGDGKSALLVESFSHWHKEKGWNLCGGAIGNVKLKQGSECGRQSPFAIESSYDRAK